MISTSDEGWECHILLKSLVAMEAQKNTCRKELMEKIYELYVKVYPYMLPKTKDYIEKHIDDQSPETIIKLYTLDKSPYNYVTNNLLRSSRNPSEIFYCQPYFRDLFQAIKSLHAQQTSNQ